MTAGTFVKKVIPCLKPVPELTWNSVQMSALNALGREVEAKTVEMTEVPDRLRAFLPSGAIDRSVESCLRKNLR